MYTMRKNAQTGISLPIELMQKIDQERGDIPRSKFIFRLIQSAYLVNQNE